MKLPKPRKLPSGSWYVRVYIDGKVVNITKSNEKECLAEAAAIKAGLKEQKLDHRLTLQRACEEYIADREQILSASTIRGYRKIMRTCFQNMMQQDLRKITPEAWQRAVNLEAKRVSAKTLKNSWGFASSVIASSTGTRVSVRLPQVVPNELPFLDADQLHTFLEAIKGDSCESQILLGLSSLRRSEILAVTWDDIDLDHNCIYVRGSAVQGDDGLVYKAENKSRTSRRTIPFILPRLRELLESVPEDKRTGLLYTGDPHKIYKHVDNICMKNGLPKIGVHGLRRTFASIAASGGTMDQAVLQKVGGWADIYTVRKFYIKASEKDIASQTERFQEAFK